MTATITANGKEYTVQTWREQQGGILVYRGEVLDHSGLVGEGFYREKETDCFMAAVAWLVESWGL